MINRLSIILSFFLATLLAIGTVELLYSSLGKVLIENKVTQKEIKGSPASMVKITAHKQTQQASKVANDDDYTIITKRNLFGTPPAISASVIVKPEPILSTTSLDLVLLGTIGGNPGDQRAIIRNRKSRKQALYSKGDVIEHGLIKQINRAQIILTVNGIDEILLMEEMKSPPSTGTTKSYPMPEVFSLPDKHVTDDDTVEIEENAEVLEKLPPVVTPRRRMTLKPKKQ